MKLYVLLLALALSACGTIELTKVKSANPRTVIVQAISNDQAAALKLADAECSKHGRVARMAGKLPDSVDLLFDCVN